MSGIKIILLCVLACVGYGVIHDQITARVCLEYFTIGHPRVLPPAYETPTNLGVVWGVLATWWVGVLLGAPLAAACRVGGLPKRSAGSLIRPLLIVACCAAIAAFVAGAAGGWLASRYGWSLPGPLGERVPADKHAAFLADFFAHNASYASGFIGGVILIGAALRWRWKKYRERIATRSVD